MNEFHEVKSWPEFFNSIVNRTRFHELRLNDRNYQIGQWLWLREFNPNTKKYTGRTAAAKITSITSQEHQCAVSSIGLNPDYCILSIELLESN